MSIPNTEKLCAQITVLATSAVDGASAKNIANVFYYQRFSVTDDWDAQGLIDEFYTYVFSKLQAAVNVDYVLKGIACRCINDAEDAGVYDTTHAGDVGGTSGERMPDFGAITVRLKTGIRGRSYMGSKHFGPVTEADTTGDIVASGALTKWNNLRDACLLNLTPDSDVFYPVVFSQLLSQVEENPTTVTTAQVTSTSLNSLVGTMRRRKAKAA